MVLRGKHVIVICECVGSSGEVRNENREFFLEHVLRIMNVPKSGGMTLGISLEGEISWYKAHAMPRISSSAGEFASNWTRAVSPRPLRHGFVFYVHPLHPVGRIRTQRTVY